MLGLGLALAGFVAALPFADSEAILARTFKRAPLNWALNWDREPVVLVDHCPRGEVTVEVYYDGKYCWQGIPDCPLADYSGKFVEPRRP